MKLLNIFVLGGLGLLGTIKCEWSCFALGFQGRDTKTQGCGKIVKYVDGVTVIVELDNEYNCLPTSDEFKTKNGVGECIKKDLNHTNNLGDYCFTKESKCPSNLTCRNQKDEDGNILPIGLGRCSEIRKKRRIKRK